MPRRFSLFALIVSAGVLAATAQAKDLSLVRLSFSSGWDALPSIVAQERGFFAEQDLVVSGLAVSSSQAVSVSLGVGTTDFAAVPQETLLFMAAAKVPVSVVSMNGWGVPMSLVVPKTDTKTKSLADLKGKTIGVVSASAAYPVLIRLLNAARLRPSDVKMRFMTAQAFTKAFTEKSADAVFETQYFTQTLTETDQGRVAINSADVRKQLSDINAMPLVVRSEFLQKNPDVVQRFVNAWVKAQYYIRQDPQDSAKLMQIFLHRQGVPVSDGLVLAWTKAVNYGKFVWGPSEIADAEYNGWALQRGGVLKVDVKLAGMIDNSFSEKAVAQLEGAAPRPTPAPAAAAAPAAPAPAQTPAPAARPAARR